MHAETFPLCLLHPYTKDRPRTNVMAILTVQRSVNYIVGHSLFIPTFVGMAIFKKLVGEWYGVLTPQGHGQFRGTS